MWSLQLCGVACHRKVKRARRVLLLGIVREEKDRRVKIGREARSDRDLGGRIHLWLCVLCYKRVPV